MTKWPIRILRWFLGIIFLLSGISNLVRYPLASVLAILLALVLIPFTANLIAKKVHVFGNKWVKAGTAGVFFALFSLLLPSTPPPQTQAIPTPLPEASPAASPELSPSPAATVSGELYRVVSVTDGDTLKVDIAGKTETIRVIGVNTPETVDPRKPAECFGQEASAQAKKILTGKSVRLEADPSQQERDRYGRLLRFIFLEDGTDVGLNLIQNGYAQQYLYDKPYTYYEQYKTAEADAKANKRGLWADDICTVVELSPIPSPKPSPKPQTQSQPSPAVMGVTTTTQPKSAPPKSEPVQPAKQAQPEPPSGGGFTCNCAKTCPNMSCAEAQFQLNSCGCSARDGDNDGTACDSQCS
jgi:micrococcal nuclease